jgi:hypothetical protein
MTAGFSVVFKGIVSRDEYFFKAYDKRYFTNMRSWFSQFSDGFCFLVDEKLNSMF